MIFKILIIGLLVGYGIVITLYKIWSVINLNNNWNEEEKN